MAKRRKLEAPSADDLKSIEEEFRRETPSHSAPARSSMAPIAQVAAEAAQHSEVLDPDIRAKHAKDALEAETLRAAQDKGLVIAEIPLDQIDADHMVRDRAVMVESEMLELRLSIAQNGLRLPIEVYALDQSGPESEGQNEGQKGCSFRYGLISGYRRLMAYRKLRDLTKDPKYDRIKTLIRQTESAAESFAAMVEENEIRASLSHFERGRVAAISAQNGVFTNVEEAVERLFPVASKAKRSKVRSFALIFEELGDMLAFPEALTEKQGLRVASALRDGAERMLREALAEDGAGDSPEAEWTALEGALASLSPQKDPSRGGRPRKRVSQPQGPGIVTTRAGVTLRRLSDDRGYYIRLEGKPIDGEMVDLVMGEIGRLLDQD